LEVFSLSDYGLALATSVRKILNDLTISKLPLVPSAYRFTANRWFQSLIAK